MQRQNISGLYDSTLAGNRVTALTSERQSVKGSHSILLAETEDIDCRVVEEENPRYFKFVQYETYEEYTFRIVGVISFMDFPLMRLPPINERLRHRSQVLGLIGCGSPCFERGIEKLREVVARLGRSVGEGALRNADFATGDGRTQIMFKCRYFTVGPDAEHTENVDIPPGVDHKGILAKMVTRRGVKYGESNRVVYQLARKLEDGRIVHQPHSPVSFRAGDLVEVRFSILGVPLADGDVRCVFVQNVVTLLDDTFALAAATEEERRARGGQHVAANPVKTLKRRADYENEENDMWMTRKGVARMGIE